MRLLAVLAPQPASPIMVVSAQLPASPIIRLLPLAHPNPLHPPHPLRQLWMHSQADLAVSHLHLKRRRLPLQTKLRCLRRLRRNLLTHSLAQLTHSAPPARRTPSTAKLHRRRTILSRRQQHPSPLTIRLRRRRRPTRQWTTPLRRLLHRRPIHLHQRQAPRARPTIHSCEQVIHGRVTNLCT